MADDPIPILTDDEALSLLGKMDVEQRTLRELWGQFSVALRQVASVVLRAKRVQELLPELTAREEALIASIDRLAPDLEVRKQAILKEETEFRQTLEESLGPLRESASQAHAQAIQANKDALAAEDAARARIEAADTAAAIAETRLAKAQAGYDAFRAQHGLG